MRRIEVTDLVQNEADRIVDHVGDSARFPTHLPSIAFADYDKWLASMRAESDTLLHLLATGVFHDDGAHDRLWLRAVSRLLSARGQPGSTYTSNLESYRHYPALLAVWVMKNTWVWPKTIVTTCFSVIWDQRF